MTGTVIVGVILSLAFLASFSEWFYHLVIGVNEIIPSGVSFYSSIVKWILFTVLFTGGMFWVLSVMYECPVKKEREGIFSYLDCDLYWGVRARLSGKSVATVKDEVLNTIDSFDQ